MDVAPGAARSERFSARQAVKGWVTAPALQSREGAGRYRPKWRAAAVDCVGGRMAAGWRAWQ
jgi:hypothetical protein